MKVLRQVGQFKLNEGDGMAMGLFNMSNDILMAQTKNEGVSVWFGNDLKEKLMLLSDADFVNRAKQLAGNHINRIPMPKY